MAMAEKEAVSKNDIQWLNDRIDSINNRINKLTKTLRLLFAHLVDKKIIGEELGKAFQETQDKLSPEDRTELIDWFMSKNVPKEKEE